MRWPRRAAGPTISTRAAGRRAGRLSGQTEIIHLRDQAADVEAAAVVDSILAAVVEVIMGLPWQQQALLAWVYLHDLPLRDFAEALGADLDQVHALRRAAVLEVHDVMLAMASEGGCGCGRGSCQCGA